MTTSIKHENDEFLVITLKHGNRLETPKLWAIPHENIYKTENNKFFVITLKHVNPTTTAKLWEIARENGRKTRKRQVFLMPSNMYRVLRLLQIALGHQTCGQ